MIPNGKPLALQNTHTHWKAVICVTSGAERKYRFPKPFLLFKDLTFQPFMITGALLQTYSQNFNAQNVTYYFALILTCVRMYPSDSFPSPGALWLLTPQLAKVPFVVSLSSPEFGSQRSLHAKTIPTAKRIP